MAWDPGKLPGPSRLKKKAQPNSPLDLGPPIPTPRSIANDPTKATAPDDPKINPAPFLLSYKDVQTCSAEFHHSPASTAEAYAIASSNNIRHCVCPICAALIAAQVVCHYATLRHSKDEAAAHHKYGPKSILLKGELKQALKSLEIVEADVRTQQLKFYENLGLSGSEKKDEDGIFYSSIVGWNNVSCMRGDHLPLSLRNNDWKEHYSKRTEGSFGRSKETYMPLAPPPHGHRPSMPLDTSGYRLEHCSFYHKDQETNKKEDNCDCKKRKRPSKRVDNGYYNDDEPAPRPPQPAAPIAAALLVAALTFGTRAPLASPRSDKDPQYLELSDCFHELPEAPIIRCTYIEDLIIAYAPHAGMCLPCARLASANCALFAAVQAMHEASQAGYSTRSQVVSLHTTFMQAAELVKWRLEARTIILESGEPVDYLICDTLEKAIAYGTPDIAH
ncbi:hypothetical protein SLS55_001725 [Diplodia seriata]|uniref:Uncharacterized protein n=1 Tax=Diplodia seriata TaxID=420778 RepID=A0ABR3CQ41_9PEZI